MNIKNLIGERVLAAMVAVGLPEDSNPAVSLSNRPQFGDYQANGVMGAAKKLKTNPRELAQKIIGHLQIDDLAEKVEIAGPGFINIFLKAEFIATQVDGIVASEHANVMTAEQPQTVVVDYSAPNVAKEMHVGHIRSTIIGDSAVRTLSFLGHNVIKANHIGDWGTQFGMLIAHLEELQNENPDVMNAELSDLEEFYRQSKKHYDEDEAFALRARNYVVKLQSGDQWCRDMWEKLVDVTLTQNLKTYKRMNVLLTREDTMGESLYNPMLKDIVADLTDKGLAVEDAGAKVVFLDEFQNKEGQPMGVIIQKGDGGFLYATTDIACAKYRHEQLQADRVLYFIDSRQAMHLQQAWTIVRKAGYIPESMSLEHHAFGMMLGKDGKPFKTRSGGVVKLSELLNEADERAEALIRAKNPELAEDELKHIAKTVAMGAVKYADLSKSRTTDYIFDWDNMLAFEGNTAPYLQYAYTRVQSIFRKAGVEAADLTGQINIVEDAERSLGLKLTQFTDVVETVGKEGMPHLLCSYLFDLAGDFMRFYEACPVNKAGVEADVKQSRLLLCAAVAKTLKIGLDLLGIDVLDKM